MSKKSEVHMFDNIGKKIMALAKVTTILGIVASILWAIILWIQAGELSSYYYENEKAALNNTAWGLLIGGTLGSWIGSFALFAFGQLVDDTQQIKLHLLSQPLVDATTSENVNPKSRVTSDYSDLPQL